MATGPGDDELANATTVAITGAGDHDEAELVEALGMAVRTPPVALSADQIVDEAYRIERILGAGGMGTVYLARDLRLHRDVAIKLHTSVAGEPGGERLMREAAAMAQLTHPNVVTVYEVGSWAGHPYVAMEYVLGGTVRAWLRARKRTVAEIVAMFAAAGRGLAAAHDAGMVHRDFKPDNVLVGDDGRIRVADFGLARGFADATAASAAAPLDDGPLSPVTATGAVMGTPAYMAPEQLAGEAGPASDQFAFAVALWEALFGRRPFAGNTISAVAAAIAAGAVRPPPAGHRVPGHVKRALVRALSTDPRARFPSMTALIAEVSRDPGGRRRRRAALGVAALAVAGLGAAAVLLAGGDDDPPPPPCARAGDGLDGAWDGARRDAMRAAFTATGHLDSAATFERVAARLDDHAARWSAQRVAACEATHVHHTQTAQLLDLRDHCLDGKRAELAALVDVLAGATDRDLLDRAIDAVVDLDTLRDCADVPRLSGVIAAPDDPASRAALVRIGGLLARARAAHAAGDTALGLPAAQQAFAEAEAVGAPAVLAEAGELLGLLQSTAGDQAAARATFEAAVRSAAEAHDDHRAVEIWLAVIEQLSVVLEQLDEAEQLRPFAEAALVRAGSPPGLSCELDSAIGTLRTRQGRFTEARQQLERAVTTCEEVRGPNDPHLASLLTRLGEAQRRLDDLAAAVATLQRAQTLLDDAYGASHPQAIAARSNVAALLLDLGELGDARAALEDVLARKERAFGADHMALASTLNNLALALLGTHQPARALVHLDRAIAIVTAQAGPDHPGVARLASVRGDAHVALGDLATAQIDYQQAMRIFEQTVDHDNPAIAELQLGLGELLRRRGDQRAARTALERARAGFAASGGDDHPDVARCLAALGRLELSEGKPVAARLAFDRAIAIFERTLGADAADLGRPLSGRAAARLADADADADAALADVERARAIHASANDVAAFLSAETGFVYAQALWATGGDRANARTIAQQAAAAFAPTAGPEPAAVDAWLRAHPL